MSGYNHIQLRALRKLSNIAQQRLNNNYIYGDDEDDEDDNDENDEMDFLFSGIEQKRKNLLNLEGKKSIFVK